MPNDLPEIVNWADRITTLIQIIGGALVVVCVAILALMLIFSLGNQNRVEFVRNAFIVIAIGVFLLFAARPISAAIKGLTNALGGGQQQQQQQKPGQPQNYQFPPSSRFEEAKREGTYV